MPERWERELAKLGSVEVDDEAVRRRVEAGPRMDGQPRRADRIAAGVVAGLVAVAAIALVWRTLPRPSDLAGGSGEVPMLSASFHDSHVVPEGPDSSYRRVLTTISFGDALEESHTSTTAEGAIVDWVAVDDLTRFVPGPTVGSEVEFRADGDDARVLLGTPGAWPNVDAFTPIDRLPDAPGEYVLVFEARYPEGIARTARLVELMDPGVLQLVLNETTADQALSGAAYVDGRRADGFLSETSYTEGDVGPLEKVPEAPRFGPDDWLPVPIGSQIALADRPTTAAAGLFADFTAFDPKEPLPIDLRSGDALVGVEPGRWLLAIEATWVHPAPGPGDFETTERALFFFPIDATSQQEPVEESVPPSPSPVAHGTVEVDIRRAPQTISGDPRAVARFDGQQVRMCPDGWSMANPDGTREEVLFDCGQDDVFEAPPGTPIVVSGDFATIDVSTRLSGEGSIGAPTDRVAELDAGTVVTYAYEVTWDDGSEASFWLLVTVGGEDAPTVDDVGIVVRLYGIGERSYEVPTATFSFAGETETACTQDFGWRKPDGTEVREEMGDTSACSERAIEVPPGTSIAIEAWTTTRVTTTRTTTPFYGGDVGLVVSAEWAEGNATFIVPLTVTETTPDLELVVLDCRPGDQIEFADQSDVRLDPGASAYITANLPGFERSDVVEQMTRRTNGQTEWSGIWQVVRDGQVVASVDWDSLSGTACRGSGIGGT